MCGIFIVLLLTKEFASLESQNELVGAFLGLGKAVLMNFIHYAFQDANLNRFVLDYCMACVFVRFDLALIVLYTIAEKCDGASLLNSYLRLASSAPSPFFSSPGDRPRAILHAK